MAWKIKWLLDNSMTKSEDMHIIFSFTFGSVVGLDNICNCQFILHFQIQHDQILNAQQKWQVTNAPKFV
jgi:hypothetical protein